MSRRVVISVVAINGWYPRGAARLIEAFHQTGNGHEIQAWVNVLPPGCPSGVIVDGYDYTPYCAKPFALAHAAKNADQVILLDAAFYPVQSIQPLIDYIARVGYYFCENGNPVGEWISDAALMAFRMSRDEAMGIKEVSSYCVGVDVRKCQQLIDAWPLTASSFPGPHTNRGHKGRNVGWCSDDSRCKGHRHDQSALSILAHRLGMNVLSQRPRFTSYLGDSTSETCLVNHGGF